MEIKKSPCANCERLHTSCGTGNTCLAWREWFRETWRTLREVFGKENDNETY